MFHCSFGSHYDETFHFSTGLIRTKREIANQASGFVFVRNEVDATDKEVDEEENEEEGDEKEDEQEEKGDEDEEADEEWTDDDDNIDQAMEDLSIAETANNSENPTSSAPSSSSAPKADNGAQSAPVRKGTEVKLVNMEFGENVSLLRLVGLALVVQCSKCKKKVDVTLGAGRTQSKTCDKCRTVMTVSAGALELLPDGN